MSPWLVTWDWANDSAAYADKIAAVLSPHLGSDRIAGIVELLYALRTSTVAELARYAGKPAANPYRAKIEQFERIHCGHNPYLYARKVSDFKVTVNPDTRIETVTWKEPPLLALENDRVVEKAAAKAVELIRRITGALHPCEIWDDDNHRFHNGWGEGETPGPEWEW
jgi:hypothetical protein